MSQLAFNEDGDPIELPPAATGWRVKRMRGTRGAPGLVYASNGAPLVIPLELDIEDLRREVGISGKYKLEAVDDRRRPLGLEEAIVFVPSTDATADEASEETPSAKPASAEPNAMAVVIEAMRQNSEAMKQNAEMARTIVDRFPAMLEAAAVLITAADGAGLPAREPQRKDRDDDDEEEADDDGDEQAPAPGFDLNAVIAQLVPVLLTAVSKGDIKLPNLAEMLDWRRAAASSAKAKAPPCGSATKPPPSGSAAKSAPKTSTPKPPASPEAAAAPEPPTDAATDAKLPPLSPQAMAHFLAIQSALTPEEAALARAAAAELSPADLRAWFDQLSALSVPAAVERVRALLNATKAEAAA